MVDIIVLCAGLTLFCLAFLLGKFVTEYEICSALYEAWTNIQETKTKDFYNGMEYIDSAINKVMNKRW